MDDEPDEELVAFFVKHTYRLGAGSCACGEWSEEENPELSYAEHLALYILAEGEVEVAQRDVPPPERQLLANLGMYAQQQHNPHQEDCGKSAWICSNAEHMAEAMADVILSRWSELTAG